MIATVNRAPVEFQGNFTLGIAGASGSSELKNVSGLAESVARSDGLRLSLIGRYVYGESAGTLAVRNARGTITLDFFVTKRFSCSPARTSSRTRFRT